MNKSDLTVEDCISYKNEIGILTFNELYLLTLTLLQQGVSIPSYDYIIIDEIQDFTELQAVILRTLVSNCKNISFIEEQRYKSENSLSSERVLNVSFKKLFLANKPVVPERQVYYTDIVDYPPYVILDYINQGYSLDDIAYNDDDSGYIYSHVVPGREPDNLLYVNSRTGYTDYNGMLYSLILYLSDSDEIIKFLSSLRFFTVYESYGSEDLIFALREFITCNGYSDSFNLIQYFKSRGEHEDFFPLADLFNSITSDTVLYKSLCLPTSMHTEKSRSSTAYRWLTVEDILYYVNETVIQYILIL